MDKELSVGILGCGMIAAYHAKAILEIPGLTLKGAFDVNEKSKDELCKTYDIKAYESKEELITSNEVDIICICLPSGFHYSVAIECIENKKHVIVEKPMTFTSTEADDIINKAKENGVYVTVISQLRYSKAVKDLKNAVDNGYLGKITSADIYMKYYRSPEYYASSNWKGTLKMDGGGALMNQGVHGVDLLQYIAGPVKSVQALSKTLCHNIEVEDTVSAVLEFESGALGVIQATTSVYPGFGRRLEISGTEGTVKLVEDTIEYCEFKDKSKNLECSKSEKETGSKPDGMNHTLHKKQIADFAKAVRNKKEPFVNAVEGKKAIEIIEAVYKAAETGEKVYLK